MPCRHQPARRVISLRLGALRLGAISTLVLTALVVLGGCELRSSPACSGGPAAPIEPTAVAPSLERQGFEMSNLSRSAECGADDVVATLEDKDDGRTVRCIVRTGPIYARGRVTRLADSPDGAVHLAADNVECFVDSETGNREEVVADVREGLALLL